jgi:TPP-dependent pyruvate/acetoin dehydrogenase alpha subunit
MYRALVETRVLSERASRAARFTKGLEACWVATAIDLKPGDLTSEDGGGALIQHVQRVGTREAARAANMTDIKKTMRELDAEKTAAAFTGTSVERLLCATGQAMALKALGGKGAVVAYALQDELKAAEWKRLFTLAAAELPLILVSMPSRGSLQVDLEKAARGISVPVIPVDAGDVVALYRVAQESIGRARAGGGAAVIECVAMGVDPVSSMRSQLVKKGICTEAWVAGVDAGFRRMVGSV